MPDPAPGTPVSELSVSERIEQVAIEMVSLEPGTPVTMALLTSWAVDLGLAAADINQQLEEEPEVCGHTGKGREEPCDRPPRHPGDHAWAATRMRRLLGDYEHDATVTLPAAQERIRDLEVTVKHKDAELAAWAAMPRWRKRPKPDRG